jgi:GWxTD domain-containing protein
MRSRFLVLLGLGLVGVSILAAAATTAPLLPEHKQWLEMVAPIMTKIEREVFGKLQTDEARAKFIQFFWKVRDTTPDTSENEFEKEYMSRVRFADQNFGYGTGKRGSLTERGYYYLLLGPPLERHMYTTESQILPCELWFYKGDERYGLPPYFYLIFYQPMGMGEYRLYYPGVEGPEKLVIASMAEGAVTRASAFKIIHDLNSELGSASLSYMPGERPATASSFSSDMIIAGVRGVPEKEFSDAYARNYLNYKDYVETEYTDSFTESSFLVRIFRTSGVDFIHWTLEPSRVNFAERNGSYVASFELVLRLVDGAGRTVLEQAEEIPLRLSEEQYRQHSRQRFAFQDLLPVIPGDYRLLFLLKNKTGKDFSSQEAMLSVPRVPGPLSLGKLLLFRSKEPAAAPAGKPFMTAFSLDGQQFLFDTRSEFPRDGVLGIYVQPANLSQAGADPAALQVLTEIRSTDGNTVAWSSKHPLGEVMPPGRSGILIDNVPLAPLKPGYYEVDLSLVDAAGKPLASQRDHFILLTQAGTLLPWAYSRQRPTYPGAAHEASLGSQYFAVGDYARAREMLEKSLALKDAGPTRLLLAKTLYAQKAYKDSLAMAAPVHDATRDREAAKIMALDLAGLEDWSSALVYLKELLQQATEVGVLNLTAECLIRLDRADEALPLLRKSLEIEPNQEEARKLLDMAGKAAK